MCHESSGAALNESIGIGKGCVKLDDFEKADGIFIIGQNPGTNHPRMMTTLERAKENGATHTFVAMHIPPAAPGAFNNLFFMFTKTEERFYALLERYNVAAALFGHLHQSSAWKHGSIECYVTPSCCWNFISRTQKVDSSFVRIVKVEQDKISNALLPVRLEGETFDWETLSKFYNAEDHPK